MLEKVNSEVIEYFEVNNNMLKIFKIYFIKISLYDFSFKPHFLLWYEK